MGIGSQSISMVRVEITAHVATFFVSRVSVWGQFGTEKVAGLQSFSSNQKSVTI